VDIIVAGFLLMGVIVVANVIVRRGKRNEQLLFSLFLLLLNIPVLLLGLFFIVVPAETLDQAFVQVGLYISNPQAFGLVLFLMATWAIVVCLPPVRRLIARVTSLDPDSAIHTLALVLVGYLVGQGALTLSQGGLAGLAENAQPTSVFLVAGSELVFAVLALLGVGYLIRRRGRDLTQRLGLEKPPPLHWLIGLGWIGVLVVLQILVGLVATLLNPEQTELLESVNTLLLADFDTVWEWLILAIAAGVGEELLFRGALQPIFGLATTSIIFALIHVQYGLTSFTLFIVVLAIILGLIRRYYSTTIAIFVHFGYDFALGLLALLATFLQQFVT
jgi:hypothetical protein